MGIIRPAATDAGNRWAVTLDDAGEQHLVGTRAAILDASKLLDDAGVSHGVHRRIGPSAPWQLVQARKS